MLIYNSDKPYNFVSALKELLVELAFVMIAWRLCIYYEVRIPEFEFYTVIPITILIRFAVNLFKVRIDQLVLDTSKQLLQASFTSISGRTVLKEIKFADCKIDIDQAPALITKKKHAAIYFYRKHELEFQVSESEGGFSLNTLEDIIYNLQKIELAYKQQL